MLVPTMAYPSLNLTLTLTSRLGQNVRFGKGKVGSFLETYIDPQDLYRVVVFDTLYWKIFQKKLFTMTKTFNEINISVIYLKIFQKPIGTRKHILQFCIKC